MEGDAVAVAISSMSSITEVLCYKNDDIVHRFADDFGFSSDAAEEVFGETKKWLWLCAFQSDQMSGQQGHPLTLFDELFVVDLMWHTFILFTHDYAEFCQKYFGTFIHHVPRTKSTKPLPLSEQRAHIQMTYEFIYDHLGADTLLYWCETLPLKYKVQTTSL